MKKLKYQYLQSVKTRPHDYFSKQYPSMRSAYFKKFSTQQERSFYFMHCMEYKDYPLNIRVARGKGLPYVWDDFPSYVNRTGFVGESIF